MLENILAFLDEWETLIGYGLLGGALVFHLAFHLRHRRIRKELLDHFSIRKHQIEYIYVAYYLIALALIARGWTPSWLTPPEWALLFVAFASVLQKNFENLAASLMTFTVVWAMRVDTATELHVVMSAILIVTFGGILLSKGQPVVLWGISSRSTISLPRRHCSLRRSRTRITRSPFMLS